MSTGDDAENVGYPASFDCPITLDIMREPMLLVGTGHSFERTALEQALRVRPACPLTNVDLAGWQLACIPNFTLRAAMVEYFESFRAKNPGANVEHPLWVIDPNNLELVTRIGKGTQGDVWCARLKHSNGHVVEVAVKMLNQPLNDKDSKALSNELLLMQTATIMCDNVCRLLGTCKKDGLQCLVMKLYDSNLAQQIAESTGPIPEETALKYAMDICRGMMSLHGKEILVLDLKPANILIDASGTCVIADLGIAEQIRSTVGCTPGTQMKGTANYAAPEAWDSDEFGGKITFKADVWSFACVMLETLTGIVPWHRLSMQQIYVKVCQRKHKPDIPEEMTHELRGLLSECLNFQPTSRPSFADVFARLEDLRNKCKEGGMRLYNVPCARPCALCDPKLVDKLTIATHKCNTCQAYLCIYHNRVHASTVVGHQIELLATAKDDCNISMECSDLHMALSRGNAVGVLEALRAIRDIAQHNEDEGKKIVAEEGDTILVCLKSNLSSLEIVELALLLLSSFCSPTGCDPLLEEGAIPIVLEALKQHMSSAQVASLSFRLICLLTVTKKGLLKVGEVGLNTIIENMIAAMRSHDTSPKLQERACEMLGNLSGNDATIQRRVGELGGIECVIAAMKQFGTEPAVQESACHALSNLAAEDHVNQRKIVMFGGVGCVVAVLQTHIHSASVVDYACGALCNISHPDNHKRLCEEGVPENLVAAMKMHGSSAGVMERACLAVCSIAADASCTSVMVRRGCLDIIANALFAHINVAEVLEAALRALIALAIHGEVSGQIQQVWNPQWILQVIRLHLRCAGVVEWALQALLLVAVESDDNVLEQSDEEDLQSVLDAMKLHEYQCTVQEWAIKALFLMLRFSEHRKSMIHGSMAEVMVVFAMSNHQYSEVVQEQGCRLFQLIASDDDGRTRVSLAGGLECLFSVLQNFHSSAPAVATHACGALCCFFEAQRPGSAAQQAFLSDEVCACVVATLRSGGGGSACRYLRVVVESDPTKVLPVWGGIDLVVACMATNAHDAQSVEEACRLLWVCAQHETVRYGTEGGAMTRLGACDGIEVVVRCMRSHTNSEGVQEWGIKLLAILAEDAQCVARIVAERGGECISAAMVTHGGNTGVQVASRRVLRSIQNIQGGGVGRA